MQEKPWHKHYDYSVQPSLRYPRLLAHELLNISVNTTPDKAALNYYGTEISFWDLKLLATRMANILHELGVEKGDRVGIHLPNCPQYMVAYYGALSIGAIVVNFNPLYTPDELTALVKQTE